MPISMYVWICDIISFGTLQLTEVYTYYRLFFLGGFGFGFLFLSLHDCFSANTPKHEEYPQPLAHGEGVAEPEHAQEHSQHLPGDSDGDQEEGREARERVEDEQLADGAACGETKDVLQRLGMPREEADSGR